MGSVRRQTGDLLRAGTVTLVLAALLPVSVPPSAASATTGEVVRVAAFGTLSSAKALPTSAGATFLVTSPQTVNSLTFSPRQTVRITGKGRLSVRAGHTVTVNGPFKAPRSPVLNGTVRFGPGSVHEAYPEWWGGGDGRPSAAAIQSAIDSLASGDVILSAATYLLDRRVEMTLVGSGDRVSAMLVPRSGIGIRGVGRASVLKVADGVTRAGDYVVFAPRGAEETSRITFSGFRFDGNAAHNLVRGTSGNLVRRAMAVWLYRGSGIRLENLWFDDQPGTNVVKFGSDSRDYLVTDSVITGCTFAGVGGALPGNRAQADHSSVYVSGRGVTVAGNSFTNPAPVDENGPPVIVVAAIEMHGDDMRVLDNRVSNYGIGGYIVADGIVTARNQLWRGNLFDGITKIGISLWSVGASGGTVIDGNTIVLDGDLDQGVAGIFQPLHPPDTTVGIDGLTISDNRIRGRNPRPGSVWSGIFLTAVRDAVLRGNTIEQVSGAGILWYGAASRQLNSRNITVQDNVIRDTGFNRFGAHQYAIEFNAAGSGQLEGVHIAGNRLERTRPLAAKMGGIRVTGSGPLRAVRIAAGNSFTGLTGNHHRIDRDGVTVEAHNP